MAEPELKSLPRFTNDSRICVPHLGNPFVTWSLIETARIIIGKPSRMVCADADGNSEFVDLSSRVAVPITLSPNSLSL
jgi:hypothetical protein